MKRLSKPLKTAALAGLFGLGMFVASATSASAHYISTRCDSDGDRCWRVVCDDDGDDCRRANSYGSYYGDYNRSDYYNRTYNRWHDYDRYNRDYGRYNRRWVCDSDGENCRWSTSRW
ncbi:MAG: hypothetical protein KGM97_06635 [Alphaproteobacteria bacterium]|nr:hypothetical protein [Alphaproteobacteria bacterium]MDE2630650.1 hypothetical protein [Alphaproteobacteria bacterium]